jgi:SnoaL-like protein
MSGRDLAALWEEHCRHEFETRDVDSTMATMVAEPYVNHVPTMTGGVGHDELKRFYKHHFIGENPPDTQLRPISRTIGSDQLVDEMLFTFTHTREIDWMAPGVAPTGRRVEVPLVAVVRFVDGKVAHGLAGRRRRGRAEGVGQFTSEQLADDALGRQRRQADLNRNTLIARCRAESLDRLADVFALRGLLQVQHLRQLRSGSA